MKITILTEESLPSLEAVQFRIKELEDEARKELTDMYNELGWDYIVTDDEVAQSIWLRLTPAERATLIEAVRDELHKLGSIKQKMRFLYKVVEKLMKGESL